MQKLSRFLTRHGLFTVGELNQAIFSFPQSGLIRALEQSTGERRARHALQKAAAAFSIRILRDSQVVVSKDAVQQVSAERLYSLCQRHKALPLLLKQHDGERHLVLAMADALDEQAKQEFAQLFAANIDARFAHEVAILAALPAVAIARGEPDRKLESVDVLRAMQQLTATAIKHQVERVEISLDAPFVKAEFFLSNGSTSPVEINVPTEALLSSLLERGAIIEREDGKFTLQCVIEFRSSSAVCTVSYDPLYTAEYGLVLSDEPAALTRRTLLLSEVAVDSAEDPRFWQSLSPTNAEMLRECCSKPQGIIVVCATEDGTRERALKALGRIYPDAYGPVHAATLSLSSDVCTRARESRVFVSTAEADLGTVIDRLRALPHHQREVISGLFFCQTLPRICELCATPVEAAIQQQIELPEYTPRSRGAYRKGEGCSLCKQQGVLGDLVIGSCLPASSVGGKLLFAGAAKGEIYRALAKDSSFQTLFEDAVTRARAGEVLLSDVQTQVQRPDSQYEGILQRSLDPTPLTQPIMSSPSPTEAKETLLLVIDQDPDQCAVLQRMFELEGYRVDVASDSTTGVNRAARLRPNVILVDSTMPEINGQKVITKLKQLSETRTIPIVALTSHSDPVVEHSLLRAGADEYCAKTVPRKVLLKCLERLVRP